MKLVALVVSIALGTALANPLLYRRNDPLLAGTYSTEWTGFPSDDVTCPDKGPSKGASFSPDYMRNDIASKPFLKPKKQGYPAKFGYKAPGAGNFKFKNDCLEKAKAGEKILELPMKTDGVTWAESDGDEGPYRVYYILKGEPGSYDVIYCGAYAHVDEKNKQDFEECT